MNDEQVYDFGIRLRQLREDRAFPELHLLINLESAKKPSIAMKTTFKAHLWIEQKR